MDHAAGDGIPLPATRICLPEAGDLVAGAEIPLEGDALRHIKARRLQRGAEILLFDGRGHEWQARLTALERRAATALVLQARDRNLESPLAITLLQGICKGDRMDYAVQKAVELGVARIVPVVTAHGVVRLDRARAQRRRAHWQQIAVSAAEQCGRNIVPEVAEPLALMQALALPIDVPGLILAPHAPAMTGFTAALPDRVRLLVGPEGGLSADEENSARHAGWSRVGLGPRILRAETATVAAITALQLLAGDLGER